MNVAIGGSRCIKKNIKKFKWQPFVKRSNLSLKQVLLGKTSLNKKGTVTDMAINLRLSGLTRKVARSDCSNEKQYIWMVGYEK